MKPIQKILEMIGDANHVRIQNAPYMPLVIERIGDGPNGLPAVSVTHYGEQNGDLMRDPEMCFEVTEQGKWFPYYFRNDYMGVEQEVYCRDAANRLLVRPRLKRDLEAFARMWSRNIREQGFVEAARSFLAESVH